MEPLEDVLKRSADTAGLGDIYLVGELGRSWSEIVGAQVARKSEPLRINNRTLLIKTASPGWSHQLALLKSTIVAKLKTRGLEVNDLRFVFANQAAEKKKKAPVQKRPQPDFSSIPDTIDTQNLRLAIASYLGTRREGQG